MFDFKFDWCKEMELGIEIIDLQHQELFRIGRSIEQLVMNGCRTATQEQLLDIVCELRDYSAYQFYTEEDLMLKNSYPNYTRHKAAHDTVKNFILGIDLPLLGKNPDQVLPHVKDELQTFLFDHILTEDDELCKFLKTLDMK